MASRTQHVLTGAPSYRFRRDSDGARVTLTKGEAIEPHARIGELPSAERRLFTRQAVPQAPEPEPVEAASTTP